MLARLAVSLLRLRDRRTPTPAAMRAAQDRIRARLVGDLARLPVGHARGLDQLPLDGRLREAFRAQVPFASCADYHTLFARVAQGEPDVCFPGFAATPAITGSGGQAIPQSSGLLAHRRSAGAAAFLRLADWVGPELLDGRLQLAPSVLLVPLMSRLLATPCEPVHGIARVDLRLVSGDGPSLLGLFAACCRERGVTRAAQVWPQLHAVIHGGQAGEELIGQFQHHLPGDTWMQEVYTASAACIAVGQKPWRLREGRPAPLELCCDHSVLLEFCPDDDRRSAACVGPEAIEAGRVYRVIVTTPGGLVRWPLDGLVRGEGPGLVRTA